MHPAVMLFLKSKLNMQTVVYICLFLSCNTYSFPPCRSHPVVCLVPYVYLISDGQKILSVVIQMYTKKETTHR